MASPATPAPPSIEQNVLQSIGEVSAVGAAISQRFGASSATALIQTVPTFAAVFVGLFDSIRALFVHHQTVTGQQTK